MYFPSAETRPVDQRPGRPHAMSPTPISAIICAAEIIELQFGVVIIALTRKHALLFTFLLATQTVAPPQKNGAATDRLDTEVKEFRVSALEAKLQTMLPGPERDFFGGVLANWNGRIDDSILLLSRALPGIRESHPQRAPLTLETLADDYTKSFRYEEAARTYDDLFANFAGQMSRRGTKDDSDLAHLLRGVPAQTITFQGPVRLKTERNPIGSLVTELTVNGVRGQWLLDTGANQAVVTRSFGRELGLKPLPGSATTGSGITGIANPLQVAVLPTLQMGGATVKTVVVRLRDRRAASECT
jgi:hypothetical protein